MDRPRVAVAAGARRIAALGLGLAIIAGGASACGSLPGLSDTCTSGKSELVTNQRGVQGDPTVLARVQVAGLLPTDMVEKGDIYSAEVATILLVRDGESIGDLVYVADGFGGWLLGSWSLCGGLSLR